jgi:DNA helicase-2/ATP-dependent DNA helicase PcrA
VRVFGEEERRRLLAQRSFGFACGAAGGDPAGGDPPAAGAAAGAAAVAAALSQVAAASDAQPELAAAADLDASPAPAVARPGGSNREQQQVIEHGGGPLLVIAGPGSGKTRTLVARIARLVAAGVSPRAITAISFTRKAAGELAERLAAELDQGGERVAACTFHSLALELLRAFPAEAGLPRDFAVLDDAARRALLPDAAAAEAISRAKATLAGPGDLGPELAAAFAAYQADLAAAGAVDFDDLVLAAARLLEGCAEARAAAHDRCRYLFVDEFQDINPAQYRLVRLLAPDPAADVCAVGDPDQAIYAFRGSDPAFFGRFRRDYPGAREIALAACYRCAPPILDAATAVIERSPGRARRRLRAIGGPGAPAITWFAADAPGEEAAFIAGEVARAIGGTALETSSAGDHGPLAFHDIAILTRTGAQAGPIEEALARAGIPTCRAGDESVLAGPEAAGLIDGLRAATAAAAAPSLDEILLQLAPRRAPAALRRARDQIAALAAPFGGDARAFLAALPLLGAGDARLEAQKVALLTLHAAKGLEFSLVVIAGCEEGLLPLALPGKPVDLDEERRLFYVGMTRARQRLILTRAMRRSRFGRTAEAPPSRFVADLPAHLVAARRSVRPPRPAATQQLALL